MDFNAVLLLERGTNDTRKGINLIHLGWVMLLRYNLAIIETLVCVSFIHKSNRSRDKLRFFLNPNRYAAGEQSANKGFSAAASSFRRRDCTPIFSG